MQVRPDKVRQSNLIPPINVLGLGQFPENCACEKSNPGFCKQQEINKWGRSVSKINYIFIISCFLKKIKYAWSSIAEYLFKCRLA